MLEVTDLVKQFHGAVGRAGIRVEKRSVQAVSGVSFTVNAGETLGLVGESGSGKTTVGRCVLRLLEPTAGSIKFKGTELTNLDKAAMRAIRKEMQIVFQDPYASLDPKRTVGAAIAEPFEIQKVKGDHEAKVADLLELVGLAPDHARRFPHEFSGGQRQRIGIARALALEPDVDRARRAGLRPRRVDPGRCRQPARGPPGRARALVRLHRPRPVGRPPHLRRRGGDVPRQAGGDRAGRARSTTGPPIRTRRRCCRPCPSPTRALERDRQRIVLEGEVPSPINPPSGCRFRTRCPKAQDKCATEEPLLEDRGIGHLVACHFAEVIPMVVSTPVHFERQP